MYIAGQTPAALRQRSTKAFDGTRPQNAGAVVYEPFAIEKQLTYVNPDNHAAYALDQGGLYDFGDEQTVRVLEVRALAALGNISIIVTDREDLQTMSLTVGGSTPAIDLVTAGVEPGDKVTVTVDAAGTEEVFTVKEVVDATTMVLEEIHPSYALVAPDAFSIVGPKNVVRYSHTLAGADTLDIDPVTTHDVPLGTPAASHLEFTAPVIVTPSQVLKVTTAGSNALGWVDVYVVKGDWF